MVSLNDKLRETLERNFAGSEARLEEVLPLGKVGGFLIWAGFEDAEQIARQSQLWDVLRRELPREEQLKITAILTVTPDEMFDEDQQAPAA